MIPETSRNTDIPFTIISASLKCLQHGIRDPQRAPQLRLSRTFLCDLSNQHRCFKNSRDIRQSAQLCSQPEGGGNISISSPRSVYRIILIYNAAVPSTVVMDDISHDNDDITMTALAVGIFPAPRPMNASRHRRPPCGQTLR